MMNRVYFRIQPSPIGSLLLTSDGEALTSVYMQEGNEAHRVDPSWIREDERLAPAARQLDEYFAGERVAFDLPLSAAGTAFQQRVWATLREIPYGETISYAELARWIGRPKAMRAVGNANGRNPIPVIVPCHRVIATGGGLGGYGGGLDRKRTLLGLEAGVRAGRVGVAAA